MPTVIRCLLAVLNVAALAYVIATTGALHGVSPSWASAVPAVGGLGGFGGGIGGIGGGAAFGAFLVTTDHLAATPGERIRYLVLPERPAGTEHLSEDALAALVTRDAMIGVARVGDP